VSRWALWLRGGHIDYVSQDSLDSIVEHGTRVVYKVVTEHGYIDAHLAPLQSTLQAAISCKALNQIHPEEASERLELFQEMDSVISLKALVQATPVESLTPHSAASILKAASSFTEGGKVAQMLCISLVSMVHARWRLGIRRC